MWWGVLCGIFLVLVGLSQKPEDSDDSGENKVKSTLSFDNEKDGNDEGDEQHTDLQHSTSWSDDFCKFDNGLTADEFKLLAELAANRFERITYVSVEEATVYVHVESLSGISTWTFDADFNDEGNVSGAYWLSSNNYDSGLPDAYSNRLQNAINIYFNGLNYDEQGKFINEKLIDFLAITEEQRKQICTVFENGLIETKQLQKRKKEEARLQAERKKKEF